MTLALCKAWNSWLNTETERRYSNADLSLMSTLWGDEEAGCMQSTAAMMMDQQQQQQQQQHRIASSAAAERYYEDCVCVLHRLRIECTKRNKIKNNWLEWHSCECISSTTAEQYPNTAIPPEPREWSAAVHP